MGRSSLAMAAARSVPARRAQAQGAQQGLPWDVVVAACPPKRRRALLRREAIRQDELSQLVFEKVLAQGELWAPQPGSRLEREWLEVRRALVVAGEIRERREVRP